MSGINRCVLTLIAVLLAGVCAVHGQERIKMCGRDLIRLAVSSCGNSRLKRSTPETQPLPPASAAPPAGDHVLPIQDPWELSETTGTHLQLDENKQIQHRNQNLKQDLNQNQDQDQGRHPDQEQAQELSMVPPWYTVPARVIRAAGRISDVCCEKGCSMRELVQFC